MMSLPACVCSAPDRDVGQWAWGLARLHMSSCFFLTLVTNTHLEEMCKAAGSQGRSLSLLHMLPEGITGPLADTHTLYVGTQSCVQ